MPGQLGHAKVSMTLDDRFGRKIAKTGAAEVLEAIDHDHRSRPERNG
jgi:hypothetical protein